MKPPHPRPLQWLSLALFGAFLLTAGPAVRADSPWYETEVGVWVGDGVPAQGSARQKSLIATDSQSLELLSICNKYLTQMTPDMETAFNEVSKKLASEVPGYAADGKKIIEVAREDFASKDKCDVISRTPLNSSC